MTVSNKTLHPNVVSAIQTAGSDPTGNSDHKKAFAKIRKSPAEQMRHPVFVLQVDQLESGPSFDAATQVGWRVISESNKQFYAFEFGMDEQGEHALHSVNEGFHVQNSGSTFSGISQRSELVRDNYSVSMLQIPSLFVEAIWLNADAGPSEDKFIPIDPAPEFLEADHVYAASEFKNILLANTDNVHAPGPDDDG